MAFTSEEIAEFKIEADELLENAELSLLDLDKGGNFKAQYDSIFRAFHSIKGAAGMMEMQQLQSHMHRLETTLTEQKNTPTLEKPYIDLFLRGIDGCRTLLRDEAIDFDYNVNFNLGAAPGAAPVAVSAPVAATPVDVVVTAATPAVAAAPAPVQPVAPLATPQSQVAKSNPAPVAPQASQATVLPLERKPAASAGVGPKALKPAGPGRILVVDDEQDIVELFMEGLEIAGYEVRGANNPVEALKLLKEFGPDAVLSDISMPEMTGLQMLAKIRETEPDLPVIFVSGFMDKRNLMEAIQLGVFGVIEKPFEMNRVVATCKNAVRQHQVSRLLSSSINLLMYQFSDLDEYLQKSGKEDVRRLIHTQMDALLEQRREWRAISKAAHGPGKAKAK